jgi:general secretion pathway protein G
VIQYISDKRKSRDEKGFTLIELLVVIVILGILAAVVVFAVGGVGDKGQRSACQIDTRTLRTANEAYAANTTPFAYTDNESTLVSRGFLSEISPLHNIRLIADPDGAGPLTASFRVTVVDADCGNVGADTGTDGVAPGTSPPANPAQPQNV